MITESLNDYLESTDLYDKFNGMNENEKQENSLYNLILSGNPELLYNMLNFFLVDKIEFNKETFEFDIRNGENIIGHLNYHNFDTLREELQHILGIKKPEDKKIKFKNALAKKMYDKLNNHKSKQKDSNSDLEIENMIRKYCTHNKNGINIFNVWDLTYYQFNCMFAEYCIARKYDFNDLMAANSFSYSKSSEYKSMDFLKKLNT